MRQLSESLFEDKFSQNLLRNQRDRMILCRPRLVVSKEGCGCSGGAALFEERLEVLGSSRMP